MIWGTNKQPKKGLNIEINKLFSYVGEENDQIDFDDLKQFEKYCVKFVNAIEVEQ